MFRRYDRGLTFIRPGDVHCPSSYHPVYGFLVTGPTMQTSIPGVFAAGDARAGSTKQLGSAVGDGISALLATRRYLELHHHLVDA